LNASPPAPLSPKREGGASQPWQGRTAVRPDAVRRTLVVSLQLKNLAGMLRLRFCVVVPVANGG
jgi:hypothetical protein